MGRPRPPPFVLASSAHLRQLASRHPLLQTQWGSPHCSGVSNKWPEFLQACSWRAAPAPAVGCAGREEGARGCAAGPAACRGGELRDGGEFLDDAEEYWVRGVGDAEAEDPEAGEEEAGDGCVRPGP
ncbi:hypothetical protein GJ744_008443 [Endocarpon pusillum]|uniref:Uncharacterized protein n=1 Tax=Endocarpon pusillum TaxID=364733 RepID=A0A8H7AHB6_9EURO|nr:hypothetical protein GJ744_008443 [Endocarpon pusillum]